ncbi:MAG: UvrD-helicase domain-containing protein, partial [Mariprofundaceae bacterium]
MTESVSLDARALEQDRLARERALDPASSFIVQAPAGSGKTGLLIQRLLVLLAHVDRPEAILALTFTRKAAAEMRERVIAALRMADAPQPGEPHEARTWKLARAVLSRSEALGWDLVSQPGRLRIMTIDAFCHALAAQLPLLSGFGGIPAIAEDAPALYREAAQAALEEMLHARDDADRTAAGNLLLHLDNRFERLIDMLAEMLGRRDQWLPLALEHRGAGEAAFRSELARTLRELGETWLGELEAALAPDWRAELIELTGIALENRPDLDLAAWQGRSRWPEATADEGETWRQLAAWLTTGNGSIRKQVNKNGGFPPKSDEKARMERLLEAMRETPGLDGLLLRVRDYPWAALAVEDFGPLDALMRALLRAAAHLRLIFSARGQCDFIEVTHRAIEALGEDERPGELLLRLDWRLQHILIDEFQDTSHTQIRLLRRLTSGWEPGDGRTLFLVGDPMQSIYRFRKADVGLFIQAAHNALGLPVRLEPLALSRNFRSRPGIVEWVNRAFAPLFPGQDDAMEGAVRFHRAVAGRDDDEGRVVLHLEHGRGDGGAREAAAMADLIAARLAEDDACRIGVLCRNRAHLTGLIAVLTQRGIPFRAVEMVKLGERPEIRLLHAMTRAMLHPADEPAWLALLRAPFPGLATASIAHLDARRGAMPWPDFLARAPFDGLPDALRSRLERWRSAADSLLVRDGTPLRSRLESAWISL